MLLICLDSLRTVKFSNVLFQKLQKFVPANFAARLCCGEVRFWKIIMVIRIHKSCCCFGDSEFPPLESISNFRELYFKYLAWLPASVTRLRYFWKFFVMYIPIKVAQILTFRDNLKNIPFKYKLLWLLFGFLWYNLGSFLF